MWKVIVYDTIYGCTASATIFNGDKATAKAIARHYNSIDGLPDGIRYDVVNEEDQE